MAENRVQITIVADGRTATEAIRNLNAELGRANSETRQAGSGMRELSRHTDGAASSLNSLGAIAKTAMGYFAVGQIMEFGRAVIEAGIAMDSLNRSFVAISGSQSGATAELGFLRKEAERLGQSFYDLAPAYKNLAAASKGTALEGEQTRAVFSAITEASTALGMSSMATEGSLRAIGQMMSKGTVQAEELRQQLGEHLPGAFKLMADAMGVSQSKLNDMLDKGEVLATDALPKLAEAIHRMYGEAAQISALESGQAAVNRLSQEWTDLKTNLFDTGAFVTATNAITTMIKAAAKAAGAWTLTEQLANAEHQLKGMEQVSGTPMATLPGFESSLSKQRALVQSLKNSIDETSKSAADMWLSFDKGAQSAASRSDQAVAAIKKSHDEFSKYVRTQEESLRLDYEKAVAGAQSDDERAKALSVYNEKVQALHEREAKSFEASQKKQTAELDRAIKERNALYAKQADNTKNTELQYFAGLEKANERAVQIINDRYDDEEKAADRAAEYVRKLQEKELEEQRERSQKFLDSITDATADVFYDMFRNIGDGWNNLWSGMKSWALKILAQLAAQAAATAIVVPVYASVMGSSTSPTGGISGALSSLTGGNSSGSGLLSNLLGGGGSLSGITDTINGWGASMFPNLFAGSGATSGALSALAASTSSPSASLAAAVAAQSAPALTLLQGMGGVAGLGTGIYQMLQGGTKNLVGGASSAIAGAMMFTPAAPFAPLVAIGGQLLSGLFGGKENSPSVIFQGQNIGWGQTDGFAYHTKDGGSNTTGNQIATALEQIAGTAFSTVESLLTGIGGDANSLSSASITFGRKTGGSWKEWDFGSDMDMTELMQKATADLQEKIYAAAVGSFNAAGQSALSGSTKADAFALLSSTGQGAYSSIMSSISAGVQGSDIQTYATNVSNFNAAMKAIVDTWDAISTSAEQAHRPMTEYQSAFQQINTQFDTWITTLGALGIAQARLDEIEADRAATLEKLTHNLQVSLDAARAQITGGSDAAQVVTLSGTYGTDFSNSSAVQSWVDWFMSATTDQLTARAAQYGVGESQLIQDMVTLAGGVSTAADEFAKLTESLVEYRNELLTSAAGGLTVGQQYVALQAEFDRTSQLASLGDQAAMSNLQDVATRYLSASSKFNANASGYQADANAVLAALDGSASAGASKSGQDLSALKAEIQQLREEQAAANFQLVKWVQQSARIQNRWDNEGMPEVRQ